MIASFVKRYVRVLLFAICTTVLFLSFYKNYFHVAKPMFFEDFQKDSESLVIGKIYADKERLAIPKRANLTLVGVGNKEYAGEKYISYELKYIFQSYAILNDGQRLHDKKILPLEINNEKTQHGFSKISNGFIIKPCILALWDMVVDAPCEFDIRQYVGRKIQIGDGQQRFINWVSPDSGNLFVQLSDPPINVESINAPREIVLSGAPVEHSVIGFFPYVSQYGVQGIISSWLYNSLNINLDGLYLVSAFAVALAIAGLVLLFNKAISHQFAIAFMLSILLSPWVTVMSRNLYWLTFSMFLPAVFVLLFYLSRRAIYKYLLAVLIFLSFVLKCLAGYEYISTIIWFAASIFLIDCTLTHPRYERITAMKNFFFICFLGVLGFCAALVIHAELRGDTLMQGLQSIYEVDVKRRTYGNPEAFPVYAESLRASAWDVLLKYIFGWDTEDFLPHLKGSVWFPFAISISILTIVVQFFIKDQNRYRDLVIFLTYFIAPVTWLLLAKAHSYIHTHISYVLWYFGFAAVCLYLPCNVGGGLVLRYLKRRNLITN